MSVPNPLTESSKTISELDPNHWCSRVLTSRLSFIKNKASDCLTICGGAENGQFCWIGGIKNENLIVYHDGETPLRPNDILIKVGDLSVSGFTTYDLKEWLKITTRNRNIITVEHISFEFLNVDLKKFLSRRFRKNSVDHELQQTIRINVYKRTVPCTTRIRRSDEVDGVDYTFVDVQQFVNLEKNGLLLESGTFNGNFYGTPKPPLQDDDDDEDDDDVNNDDDEEEDTLHISPYNLQILPPGWERVDNFPDHDVIYVDHINKRTQSEFPSLKSSTSSSRHPSTPSHLAPPLTCISLLKGAYGLGFTIIGGDQYNRHLQVKNITPGGPAHLDGSIRRGDLLVEVNGVNVLNYSHQQIVQLFQNIPINTSVNLKVSRGHKLTFDPDDPNNKIITTVAVKPTDNNLRMNNSSSSNFTNVLFDQGVDCDRETLPSPHCCDMKSPNSSSSSPSLPNASPTTTAQVVLKLIRGSDGFRFTITDSSGGGQKVRSIVDPRRCVGLCVGDVIQLINNIHVINMKHKQVVDILNACPVGLETEIVVLRRVDVLRGNSIQQQPISKYISVNDINVNVTSPLKPTFSSVNNNNSNNMLGLYNVTNSKINNNNNVKINRSKTPGPILISTQLFNNNTSNHQQQQQRQQQHHHFRSKSTTRLISQSNTSTPDFMPATNFNNNKNLLTTTSTSNNKSFIPSTFSTRSTSNNINISSNNNSSNNNTSLNGNDNGTVNSNSLLSHNAFNDATNFRNISQLQHQLTQNPTHLSSSTANDQAGNINNITAIDNKINKNPRIVTLTKQANQTFGITVASTSVKSGSQICDITAGSPAAKCGQLFVGDELLAINGTSVLNMSHGEIVQCIINSGRMVTLTVVSSAAAPILSNITTADIIKSQKKYGKSSDCLNTVVIEKPILPYDERSNNFSCTSDQHPSIDLINKLKQQHNINKNNVNNNIDVQNNNRRNDVNEGNAELVFKKTPSSPPISSSPPKPAPTTLEKFQSVELERGPHGFGFTITGGRDLRNSPSISVFNINDGSPAHGNIRVGDDIIEINGQNTSTLTQSDAKKIISASNKVVLLLKRRNHQDITSNIKLAN
ncbi:hypothetical protein HELRODRAFT_191177 [Helobdella robusta]|uniref:Uncharacterized protein n=1 Tax=Helobdella robusta TaxID=6412 RepID=T1FSP7_HELRO|nr:hypothetical protein HELRODRAFT_191177 [Helobdella robusta]ESO07417.1 hypothetical protein HELRODRAFT_191177 [Helobdella robusta]